ncbi:diacylglycerol/lipid kinase family protein [Mangrovibrevibacter kandeliae]|uniref:diacylglycerol/lipid kinase family protein n=1 Tax=Mangrovibrevibacter kandeliae TaxID=2968473 RepID=UPI00211976F9|nr:diacylglycerol kinase family protein [Aurantimonas sp. CSK15Z-1]MCQ8784093.1 diacylglycerol kinase [Aurantimonas sp. CSK15Z-1]
MPGQRFHIVMNPNSGTVQGMDLTPDGLREKFEAAGLQADVDADADTPFPERIEKAMQSPAGVLVSAGGDGTATALASAIIGSDKTLAVLPLGTANLLARDLKMPLDLDEAIGALATMERRWIDAGEVNGRVFLHKVVIGFVPGVAAGREALRGRSDVSAKLGFVRYFFRRLSRSRKIAVEIDAEGEAPRVVRAQAVAVANNAYDEGFARFFSRSRLDAGTLNLYVLKRLNLSDLFRLTAGMVLGHWREHDALAIEAVPAVTIRSHKRQTNVMIDGEVETLDVPLRFAIRPLALAVLAPAAADEVPNPVNEPDERLEEARA